MTLTRVGLRATSRSGLRLVSGGLTLIPTPTPTPILTLTLTPTPTPTPTPTLPRYKTSISTRLGGYLTSGGEV